MDKKLLYKKAYRMLENSTPLKIDCGLICGQKCCKGDGNTGMHLYPGEESLYNGQAPDFLKIRQEAFAASEVLFIVCNSHCHRSKRPLACRIYPYVPYLDGDGRLSIIADPRAKYVCPLLTESLEFKSDFRFLLNLKKVFRYLIIDREIRSYIESLSTVLDEYKRFVG